MWSSLSCSARNIFGFLPEYRLIEIPCALLRSSDYVVSVKFIQFVDGVYTANSVAYIFRDGAWGSVVVKALRY